MKRILFPSLAIATLAPLSLFAQGAAAEAPAKEPTFTDIAVGDSIQGTLQEGDDLAPGDQSFVDFYRLPTTAGKEYRILLTSEEFDAYLMVDPAPQDPNAAPLENDDDAEAGGTNSALTVTATGDLLVIAANVLTAGNGGAYTLLVTEVGGEEAAAPAEGKPE